MQIIENMWLFNIHDMLELVLVKGRSLNMFIYHHSFHVALNKEIMKKTLIETSAGVL